MRWPEGRLHVGVRFGVVGALLLGGVVLWGCGGSPSTNDYEQHVMQSRVERDMAMREKESVLPPDRRDTFRGLDFYEVDPAYRFVRPLRRKSSPDTVLMAETTGDVATQVRVGFVRVPLPTGEEQLAVFQGSGSQQRGRLWVPFADSTNGETTYKAGRYVDLEPRGADSVVVDFNRAYNPTCAYNPDYACPLPPEENEIDAPVPVGERKPLFGQRASS